MLFWYICSLGDFGVGFTVFVYICNFFSIEIALAEG